ncbi:MAG: ATP-binding protein [Maribacter sp.]
MTPKEKINNSNSQVVQGSLIDGFGLITLISTVGSVIVFLGTLFFASFIAQLVVFVFILVFSGGLILNHFGSKSSTRFYMTTVPPSLFGITILMVGGFFGQAFGIATMIFLTFIVYREKPNLRKWLIAYDVLIFILPTIYITQYAPLLGEIDLQYDEIVVFIACLAWLSTTFEMYDENKTRKYTDTLEHKNLTLKRNQEKLTETKAILEAQNKKLSALNHELNVKNKQIEEFTYIVTHDLKSPLSNINSIAKELQNLSEKGEIKNSESYLKHLTGNSYRMTKLVQSLMEYAEIGSSELMTEVDCNVIVSEVMEDLSEQIKKSNAKIQVGELPKIIGNEREIRMVFQNIIDNALKFRIEEENPHIIIAVDQRPGHYLFSIQDNGIGIPVEQKGNVFNAFQRLHNQNEYEGSGIGLYGCKRVIDIHRGRIWVESEENKGSTFFFTISSNLV